jgi:hypothetical protein
MAAARRLESRGPGNDRAGYRIACISLWVSARIIRSLAPISLFDSVRNGAAPSHEIGSVGASTWVATAPAGFGVSAAEQDSSTGQTGLRYRSHEAVTAAKVGASLNGHCPVPGPPAGLQRGRRTRLKAAQNGPDRLQESGQPGPPLPGGLTSPQPGNCHPYLWRGCDDRDNTHSIHCICCFEMHLIQQNIAVR